MAADASDGVLHGTRRNATIGWLLTIGLCVLAVRYALEGSYRWFLFTGLAVGVVVFPAIAFRDPWVMPPWELLVLVAFPVVDASVLGQSPLTDVAVYVAVAAVALLVAVEVHRFTAVEMNHSFAVALVLLTTLAVAATWNVAQWVSDVTLGTAYVLDGRSQDAANREMMIDFGYAALAGLLAGALFDRHFRSRSPLEAAEETNRDDRERARTERETAANGAAVGGAATSGSPTGETAPDDPNSSVPSFLRNRLDVPEHVVRRLSRIMQVALAVLLVYGLAVRDVTTIANAGIALALTFLPAVLERDSRPPLEPELVFWLTAAVFLHALGSAGLYALLPPWDSLTHALSASIVAAAGYAVVRGIDLHSDDVYLPPKMLFAFILVFVLAFGVLWELLEFAIDTVAQAAGYESAVLAQHGIDDTVTDLLFNTAGALLTALWGSIFLTDVSHRIAERLEA